METAKKLQLVHEQSYSAVKAKLQEQIDKYSTDTGLSLSEVNDLMKSYKLDKATEEKIQTYVANKDFSPAANEFLKEYNFVTRVSGLDLLRNNIGVNLIELGVKREDIIKDSLTKAQIQELTTNKGIMAAMPGTGKPVESTINASYHGATWSDRIWNSMDGLRAKLDIEMRKALTMGTGYPMPAALKKEFGVTTNEAKRLAYTEMTRVRVDARLQRFKDNGVAKYKYNAIVDTRTSDVCLGLNGMVFNLDEGAAGVNLPPMHPYCRSSVVPVRDKLDTAIEETPEESLKFAQDMLAKNPDSQLWKDIVDYQKSKTEAPSKESNDDRYDVYGLAGARKPQRPKSSDFTDNESYLKAREKYRLERAKYDEYLQEQVEIASEKNPIHKTYDDVMKALRQRGLNSESLDLLEGDDYRTFDDLITVYDSIAKKYPQILSYSYKEMVNGKTIPAGVKSIIASPPGEAFEAAYDDSNLYLGNASFKSYSNRVGEVLGAMGREWFVEGDGTYKSIYRHEFGHAMDDYIQNKIRDGKESPEYSAKLAEYTNELMSLRDKDGCSEYSFTTPGETFAEGFAAYEGGQDTEFAKRFGEFLKKWV